MFKFGTIGAFKQVRNNPRCKVTKDSLPGEVVIPNDATKKAQAPSTPELAKGDVWVIGNIVDKPEVASKADFKVLNGEYALAFLLSDLKDLPVELDAAVIKGDYATLAKGDKLVATADGTGKWEKGGATVAEYKVALEIVEKSTFGGKGIYAVVRVK